MEWIKVKDRLPETDDERICIVCYTEVIGGGEAIGRAWAFFNDNGTDATGNSIKYFKEYYGDSLISNVTHWMPLPQTPKN